MPHVAPSLTALQSEQKLTGRSLGIVRPDRESLKFRAQRLEEIDPDEQEVARQVVKQASLLEKELRPLDAPTHSFSYTFTSGGKSHSYQIHDWEVQAAFRSFKQRYGSESEALNKMEEAYGRRMPEQNLHFIMGTMQKRPWQFISIGLLRSKFDPEVLERQVRLFG
jgi:hypothetical protein